MTVDSGALRSPDEVGYLAWGLHRLSAIVLIVLLVLHVGVQVYPQYGFAQVYQWGIYPQLLDFTLGVILLHGVLGYRAFVLETDTSVRLQRALILVGAILAGSLLVYRVLG